MQLGVWISSEQEGLNEEMKFTNKCVIQKQHLKVEAMTVKHLLIIVLDHSWFAVYKRDDEKKHKLKQKTKTTKMNLPA